MKKDWSKLTEEDFESMPFMRSQAHRIMKQLGISGAEFSKLCKRTPGYFNSITGEIDTGTVRNLKQSIPNLNLMWLICGKGEMFDDTENSSNLINIKAEESKMDCPVSLYNELFQKYSELTLPGKYR